MTLKFILGDSGITLMAKLMFYLSVASLQILALSYYLIWITIKLIMHYTGLNWRNQSLEGSKPQRKVMNSNADS